MEMKLQPQTPNPVMKTSDLIFIGIKGSVVALNRHTGQQVWVTRLKGGQFVNLVVECGAILASDYGEVFCLDPLTGQVRWHNPLKGFGRGLATIASEYGSGGGNAFAIAEKLRQDEEAASTGATAVTCAASA